MNDLENNNGEIELYFNDLEEMELQAFGSPGGKSHVVKKLLRLVPEHKTYIEPFAGGAALYWKKEPVELEVLNDKDQDIAFAYKLIKNITEDQVKRINALNWIGSKKKFFRLRDSKVPSDPIERFYRFYYVHYHSYGGSRKTYGYKNQVPSDFSRLLKYKERMKNTKVFSSEANDIIRKFDSDDTFIYLDPPYPGEWPGHTGINAWGEKEVITLHKVLKETKGKWLLSINNVPWIKEIFSDFNINTILVPRKFKKGDKPKYELIISNYDLKELQETPTSAIRGAPINGFGLQPIWIWGKKKKREEEIKMPSSEVIKLIEDVKAYDPSKPNNKQLSDDWRIVNGWYSTYKETEGEGIKFSKETIVNLAKIIYEEIVKRIKEEKMKHEFKPEEMKPDSLELFKIVSRKSGILSDWNDLKFLDNFDDFLVIKDCISLIGSSVTQEHKPNDIDLLVRMKEPKNEFLKRAVEVRLSKMIPNELQDKIHFVWGEKEGPHDSFIPLFDLQFKRIRPVKVITMIQDLSSKIQLMKPFSPMKPLGSAYYDLNKFMEVLTR